jgi:hypothetical protein
MRDETLAAHWLHRLDSFTQQTYGRCRSLCAIQDECVSCGRRTTKPDAQGRCARCAAQLAPDYSEIVLFRRPDRVKRVVRSRS